MADERRRLASVTMAVRWRDMDENGHVNNAAFFTYMEQARIDWFREIGLHNTVDGHGPVVASASCEYRRALEYPATIAVTLECGPPGRSSFTLYNSIWLESDPAAVYAEGRFVLVWVDRASGKSVPLPDAMRRRLTG